MFVFKELPGGTTFATALVGLFNAHFSAPKFFLVEKIWWS